MNQQKAEQQAREICHKEGSYWYQVETEITTALLAAYQEGKKEGADRVKELEEIAREHVEDVEEAASLSARMFTYSKAKAALEAKSEGVGE